MADNRMMEEMLQAPTEGYGDAIVVPDIFAENIEIRTGLLSLIQANQFHDFESNNPHDHIKSFNRVISNLKFRDVSNDAIKLMLFPYSLVGAARIWIDKLTDTISNLVETFNKKMTTPAMVKAVEETCVICGGAHPYYDCIATDSNISSVCATTGTYNQGNTRFYPHVATNYRASPLGFPPINSVKNELISDISNQTNELRNMMASYFQMNTASSLGSGSLPSNTVPNPRADLKAITTRSGVTLAGPSISPPPSKEPSPASTSFSTISSSKMLEVSKNTIQTTTTLVNENCSTVILRKFHEKLGDPGKFLIPCDFLEFDECLALADLSASINLMPFSIWRKLSLPELTPTQMILELTDRPKTRPDGIAEGVFVKVGKFHFPTDFVVIDYVVDPAEELTLRVDDEAITFNVGQTSKYSYNDAESINPIDVIGVACEDYVQEVLGFFDNSKSGSPTPTLKISSSSPSFTPFEGSDFILEEIKTFLQTTDELSNLDDDYYDTEGDIFYLEKLQNKDPVL
nr:reverse transcriptase domain-containing protein [Tanacetum cinerariifolium]